MGAPRRQFSWVERPPRVLSRPRGVLSLIPTQQADRAYLANRKPGGRAASEVRGEGGLTGCVSAVCATTEIGKGGQEEDVATPAAQPGDKLPDHLGQPLLHHLLSINNQTFLP